MDLRLYRESLSKMTGRLYISYFKGVLLALFSKAQAHNPWYSNQAILTMQFRKNFPRLDKETEI